MAAYTKHSKWLYRSYDDIQTGINEGLINIWDIVLCSDTKEMIVVKEDYELSPVKSKVYRYNDIESAQEALNTNTDTYEGQIVSVIVNGKYKAFVVNRSQKGTFDVSPVNESDGNLDYDTLGNKPIYNLYGNVGSPIILNELTDGTYKIDGSYKITTSSITTFSSSNGNLFLVQHEDDSTYIKKISAYEIIDYFVDSDSAVTTSTIPTTQWLELRGYATETYVDNKLAALEFITKDEVEEYVNNIVLQNIDQIVDTRIDIKLNEKLEATSNDEIIDMFTSNL